jgi:hypothetical protein
MGARNAFSHARAAGARARTWAALSGYQEHGGAAADRRADWFALYGVHAPNARDHRRRGRTGWCGSTRTSGESPDRVGFLGFSAGGMVASATVLRADSATRPSFAAMIYGAPFGVMPYIPRTLPPLFMAWAQDDNVVLTPVVRFYDALRSAGHMTEVHISGRGRPRLRYAAAGTSSDPGSDAFYGWMEAGGWTRAPSADR